MSENLDQTSEVLQMGLQLNRLKTFAGRALAVITLATTFSAAAETSAYASGGRAIKRLYNATYWAGYEVDSPQYLDYVETDFIVPSITCPPSGDYYAAMWAGTGTGEGTDDLYQTGVMLECSSGAESSSVWWEDYPNNSEQDYPTLHVSAGDKIVAQVLPNSGPGHNVELYVYDFGTNLSQPYPNWTAHHEISLSAAPSASTSECVVEQPELGDGTETNLLDFGSIDFSTAASASPNVGCDVTANDTSHIISSSSSTLNHNLLGTALTIEDDNNNVLADTSSPSSSGEFTVTWDASS